MFSFRIIAENFGFMRMTFLIARFCRWYVRMNAILSLSSASRLISSVGAVFPFGYSGVRVAAFF